MGHGQAATSPASRGPITSSSARATGGWRSMPGAAHGPLAGGAGAVTLHWREVRTRDHARYYASPGNPRTHQRRIREIDWDDFAVVPRLAHERGMRAELYVSVLDEGRPLPSRRERERSFHNAMHGQHVTWQSTFSRAHPEFAVVDRAGGRGSGASSASAIPRCASISATASRSTCADTTGMASFSACARRRDRRPSPTSLVSTRRCRGDAGAARRRHSRRISTSTPGAP